MVPRNKKEHVDRNDRLVLGNNKSIPRPCVNQEGFLDYQNLQNLHVLIILLSLDYEWFDRQKGIY